MKNNKVYLYDYGILPNTGLDCYEILQKLFDEIPDNTEVCFQHGKYNISKQIKIANKNNCTVIGEESVIVAHFDPCDYRNNNDVFYFENCNDLTIKGFIFETDNPIGAAGEVLNIDYSEKTLDLKIYDEFKITGYEHFCATNSFDDKGSPDYALATYNGAVTEQEFTDINGNVSKRLVGLDYDLIGENIVRLKLNNALKESKDSTLKIGHKINIRYEIYGNTVFLFKFCNRVTIKNIIIYSASSFGITIKPRCSDFLLENFSIRVPENSKRLMAANADGVHILGLTGSLTFKNCDIESLGDDTVNAHGLALKIESINFAKGRMTLCGRDDAHLKRVLNQVWALENDIINVYDSQSLVQKGSFRVKNLTQDGELEFDSLKGCISEGDALANTAYFVSVHFDGCKLKSTRARGALLQTSDILVENCHIYGMSLAALLFAPDVKRWWEVAPSKNVEIRNNVIEHCAHIKSSANHGAIIFKTCHDAGGIDSPAGVHKNINIHDNKFIDIANSAIFISAAENIKIENNQFVNCCYDVFDKSSEYSKYDIVTLNCNNICVKNNSSSRGNEFMLYNKNCIEE